MHSAGRRLRRIAVASSAAGALALVAAGVAQAHAHVSPPVVVAKESQVFTVAVPTEKEDASTTKVELTPPAGFSIDSFGETPGWKLDVQKSGSGEEATVEKVTWSGGSIPAGGATMFQFLGRTDADKTYEFEVRQTYSDGSIVEWTGAESSDSPAPTIQSVSSLGGGSSSTLGVIALVVAAAALLLAGLGLAGGRRALA